MTQKFEFLVKNSNSRNLIYATKFGQHHWHYFEEEDTIISQHDSLPRGLEYIIESSTELRKIELNLNDEQAQNYYQNGNFIFRNNKLKTFGETIAKSPENRPTKRKVKCTREITFVSGETNPLLFLVEFEKCLDIKTDQDKMQKLRDFVDEQHKPEFSQMQFTSDWPNMKNAFIIKYTLPFIENKKKDMNVKFSEEPSLRSFVNRKFTGFAKYTTLTLVNQMEMILNELPDKVAHLFMVNEKFDCRKEVILEFCDSIQDVAQKYIADKNTQADTQVKHNEPLNRMEIFNYDPDDTDEPMLEDQSSKSDINVASTSRGRGRGRGRGKDVVSTGKITKRGRGRPRKKLTSIVEEDVDSESYDCLDQVSNSSRSSWSSRN